jgi:hypothetical protein
LCQFLHIFLAILFYSPGYLVVARRNTWLASVLTERGPYLPRQIVQLRARRLHGPLGLYPEPVTPEAREDVKMDMEDLLPRRLAVGKEEVYTFAFNACATNGVLQTHSHTKELGAHFLVRVRQVRKCFSGTTRRWPMVTGLVSIKATTLSSLYTKLAGSSRAIIRHKMQLISLPTATKEAEWWAKAK